MLNLFLLLFAGYVAGLLFPLCFPARPRIQNILAHGSAGLASGAGILLGVTGLFAPEPWTASVQSTIPFLSFAVRLDSLASFFVLTISLVGLAASIYAFGYVNEFYGRASIAVLGALFNGFLLSMTLVVIADNGFFFLIVWELMSLLSYFLVVTEHEKAEVRYAGLFYLIMTHVGTAFIILAFLIFFQAGGSFSFEAFRHPEQPLPEGMRTLVFLMALIGFGSKAGIVPLHVWLPYAHPAAPSHISALMSGVMIKTAIYALVRVYFDFLGGQFPWWWGFVVLVIGAVSALLGVMYALMEHDLKSLLAYHSVENIGIILLGIGAGMVFESLQMPAAATLALVAALYHTVNHAVFKGLLFLGAGAVLHATHTRNMNRLGGLIRGMPWTAALFLVGSAAISGLPPLNGFVSEWLLFQSLLPGIGAPSPLVAVLMVLSLGMLALTAGLCAACFVKAFGITFLAIPRSPEAERAHEAAWSMRAGMVVLAVACLALSIGAFEIVPRLSSFVAPLVGV